MEINIWNEHSCLICMNTNMLKTASDSINCNILKTVNAASFYNYIPKHHFSLKWHNALSLQYPVCKGMHCN